MLTWVEVDTNAVRRNIEALRATVPETTAVMCVVKANAYGHGLATVAPAVAESADWLGVNHLDEALLIRSLGIRKPIAILGHTEAEGLAAVVAHDLRQAVYRQDVAELLSRHAVERGGIARLHLKVETGTNRQGISLDALAEFVHRLKVLPGIEIEGVHTHFANIEDTLDPSFAQLQIQRFHQALEILAACGVTPRYAHAAATAGALLYPETAFAMVRFGIGAYGIWPSRETRIAARERGRQVVLAPALAWKTRIVQVKRVAAGGYVGYGLTYQASRPMNIGILPIGYYDGYDRKLSNCGRALVRNRAVPVVGRVAMNMTVLDVTDTGAEPDDEVVLIGRQGPAEIRAEELAEKIGTIGYEVVSRINPAIPRIAV